MASPPHQLRRRIRSLDPQRRVRSFGRGVQHSNYNADGALPGDEVEALWYNMDGPDKGTLDSPTSLSARFSGAFSQCITHKKKPVSILCPKRSQIFSCLESKKTVRWRDLEASGENRPTGCCQSFLHALDDSFEIYCLCQQTHHEMPSSPRDSAVPVMVSFETEEPDYFSGSPSVLPPIRRRADPILSFRQIKVEKTTHPILGSKPNYEHDNASQTMMDTSSSRSSPNERRDEAKQKIDQTSSSKDSRDDLDEYLDSAQSRYYIPRGETDTFEEPETAPVPVVRIEIPEPAPIVHIQIPEPAPIVHIQIPEEEQQESEDSEGSAEEMQRGSEDSVASSEEIQRESEDSVASTKEMQRGSEDSVASTEEMQRESDTCAKTVRKPREKPGRWSRWRRKGKKGKGQRLLEF